MHKGCICTESGLAKYQFTRETIDVYSCGVYNDMLHLDPFTSIDDVTQALSKSLHKATTNALPNDGLEMKHIRCDGRLTAFFILFGMQIPDTLNTIYSGILAQQNCKVEPYFFRVSL